MLFCHSRVNRGKGKMRMVERGKRMDGKGKGKKRKGGRDERWREDEMGELK